MAVGYNERAWAVDVISQSNFLLTGRTGPIRKAGGEYSLSGGETTLFPDVLLFSDAEGKAVVCGWELKFPDTRIGDHNLIENAIVKADRLGTDLFVLWNVREAQLWCRADGDAFQIISNWSVDGVSRRDDVDRSPTQWGGVLEKIILGIADLISRGMVRVPTVVDALGNPERGLVAEIMERGEHDFASALRLKAASDRDFRAKAESWWQLRKFEFAGDSDAQKWGSLARAGLAIWVNRFALVHLLRSSRSEVTEIVEAAHAPLQEMAARFHALPASTDFAPIFSTHLGEECVPDSSWSDLIALNQFLRDLKLENALEIYGNEWLQRITSATARRAAGQYRTPRQVAELLVALTVDDISSTVVWDPCCGTGTIARAALDQKITWQVPRDTAYSQVWLSDKYSTPLQAAQIGMIDADAIGQMIRLFAADVFELEPGHAVHLADPQDGTIVEVELPDFGAVVTNAPFVSFASYQQMNPSARRAEEWLAANHPDTGIDGRADLYASIVVKLASLLSEGAKLGIVTSNSWLGAKWGKEFLATLSELFVIEAVVISGSGRWFVDADVVTTLMVLKRRGANQTEFPSAKFVTTMVELQELRSADIEEIAAEIDAATEDGKLGSNRASVRIRSSDEIDRIANRGLSLTACFVDVSWLHKIEGSLVAVTDAFSVARGARPGWNDMFYPEPGRHRIEDEYLLPALRSSASQEQLVVFPDAEAFSCERSIAVLKELGHDGALEWISRFENLNNNNGVPLTESLGRTGPNWYSMAADCTADFVTSTNPGRRLFFGRFEEPHFVDQRLIRLTAAHDADPELIHALLNTSLSMFLMEALGFGRGLGALDINATNLRDRFKILNPSIPAAAQRDEIVEAFKPLLARDIEVVEDELQMPDRLGFDELVARIFGFATQLPPIRCALLDIHRIRNAATS